MRSAFVGLYEAPALMSRLLPGPGSSAASGSANAAGLTRGNREPPPKSKSKLFQPAPKKMNPEYFFEALVSTPPKSPC